MISNKHLLSAGESITVIKNETALLPLVYSWFTMVYHLLACCSHLHVSCSSLVAAMCHIMGPHNVNLLMEVTP